MRTGANCTVFPSRRILSRALLVGLVGLLVVPTLLVAPAVVHGASFDLLGSSGSTGGTISYVMEPFDSLSPILRGNDISVGADADASKSMNITDEDAHWFRRLHNGQGKLNLTLLERPTEEEDDMQPQPLFGTGALQIDYTVQVTETWGGFVDFGWIFQDPAGTHNCHGAEYLSLWVKVVQAQSLPKSAHLRVILLDDSDCVSNPNEDEDEEECGTPPGLNLEQYYTFHDILDGDNDDNGSDWKELRMKLKGSSDPFAPFWRTGWLGQAGNDVLDLNRIRGWRMELSMAGEINDAALQQNTTTSGIILVDHLSCVGGGELLGAAFYTTAGQQLPDPAAAELAEVEKEQRQGLSAEKSSDTNTTISGLDDINDTGSWYARAYQSNISENLTTTEFDNHGILTVNYTIEQSEAWGGFVDFEHLAPGGAYYNLSGASSLTLEYETLQAASIPERLNLRLILMDASDCQEQCDAYPGDVTLEQYYSFHSVLDGVDMLEDSSDTTLETKSTGSRIFDGRLSHHMTVELAGDDDPSSPFSLPGWSGIEGNEILDTSKLKGFRIEFNIDSQEGIGTLVSGAIAMGNLRANTMDDYNNTENGALTIQQQQQELLCTMEPDLNFVIAAHNTETPLFELVEFMGGNCCETCDKDPHCLYAMSMDFDCYIASSLDFASPKLRNSEYIAGNVKAYVTNDPAKRGDFCDLCDCHEVDRTIDCQGRDLRIVPKTFAPRGSTEENVPWMPTILDLRNNSRLFMLNSNALNSIADGLMELRLPTNLRHLSEETIRGLHLLSKVLLEELDSEDRNGITPQHTNFITNAAGSFGDVCCQPGVHVDLAEPSEGLTFCNISLHVPGIDSTYIPFASYFQVREHVDVLKPNSIFMSEASESPQKCAEYCAITDQCNYFTYDGRYNQEHWCWLHVDNGTLFDNLCCKPEDYGDKEQTTPGKIAGQPPRTRHEHGNARVLVAPIHLSMDKAGEYKVQYNLALGASPIHGAVWIEPQITSDSLIQSLNVSISPRRVVLYDHNRTATVTITVSNAARASTGATIAVTNVVQSCDSAFTSATAETMARENTVVIHVIPEEDMSYLESNLKITGISFVVVQGIFSLFFLSWTIYNRERGVVKRSQPVFLLLVNIGCCVISLSILPALVQGEYRYELDEFTKEETDVLNNDIGRLDAACMAVPWLFTVGFIVTFSALFAKIWRIRMIVSRASQMRRAPVLAKDVALIVVGFTSVEVILMLIWQLVDPLRWERKVVHANEQGYPVTTVGYCTNDHALPFVIVIGIYNLGCLGYARFLCHVTRDIPSSLNESKWITMSIVSIFQILILAIPVLIIAFEDPQAYFFVRACVSFLISMGVTLFIFIPKFRKLHFRGNVGSSMRNTSNHSNGNTTGATSAPKGNLNWLRQSAAKAAASLRLSDRQEKDDGRQHLAARSSATCDMTSHAHGGGLTTTAEDSGKVGDDEIGAKEMNIPTEDREEAKEPERSIIGDVSLDATTSIENGGVRGPCQDLEAKRVSWGTDVAGEEREGGSDDVKDEEVKDFENAELFA